MSSRYERQIARAVERDQLEPQGLPDSWLPSNESDNLRATGHLIKKLIPNRLKRQKLVKEAVLQLGYTCYMVQLDTMTTDQTKPEAIWKAVIGRHNYVGTFEQVVDKIAPQIIDKINV